MSGTAIVRALLGASPAVTALVPNARIIAGQVQQGTILPAISVRPVSGGEKASPIARNLSKKMIEERIQVTVLAKSFVEMEKVLKAASLGPGVHTGTVVGFRVNSIVPSYVGPYLGPAGDEIHEQSRDFMVTFVEAN
jgi:uncharacterized membrane protein YczE